MHSIIPSLLRLLRLLPLWLALLAWPALAYVSTSNGFWWEEVEAFRIKTLAGDVRVVRDHVDQRWQINARWNPLSFELDNFDGSIRHINRNGALFERQGAGWRFNRRIVIQRAQVSFIPPGAAEGQAPNDLAQSDPDSSAGGGLSLGSVAGFRWQSKDGDWADYDDQGRMVSYGDRNNLRVWLEYGSGPAAQQIQKVRDHFGRTLLRYVWQNGQVSAIEEQLLPNVVGSARQVRFTWQGEQLVSVSDVLGNVTRYDYDAGGKLIRSTDPEGRVTSIAYAGNRVARLITADGAQTDYAHDYDKLRQVFYQRTQSPATEAGRRLDEKWYNADGKLIRHDVNGVTQSQILIDTSSNRTRRTDANNLSTLEERDSFDNLTRTTYPDGSQTRTTWSAVHGQKLDETDELGVKTQYLYDGKGNLRQTIEAVGLAEQRVTEYNRDAFGRVLTETRKGGPVSLPDGDTVLIPDAVTRYAWDERGNRIRLTDGEGGSSEFAYDALGRVIRAKDGRGYEWRTTWDAAGRLLSHSDPLNQTSRLSYDKAGQISASQDAENHVTTYGHDGAGRLIRITDALGNSRTLDYDATGQLTARKDELGNGLLQLSYDQNGRLLQSRDGNGNRVDYQYGASGNSTQPTQIRYPGFTRQLTWDVRGRNTGIEDTLDAGQRYLTQQAFDAKGNLIKTTDRNGNASLMQYDGLGRLIQLTDAQGGVTRYRYDTRDNLLSVTDAQGNTSRYRYDQANRKTAESRPLGETQSYAYDPVGHLIRYQDAKGNILSYSYDAASNRIGEQHTSADSPTQRRDIQYRYNGVKVLVGYSDSQGNRAQYTLDALGRRTAEVIQYDQLSFSLATGYAATGQKASQTWPDGSQVRYAYDANQGLQYIALNEGRISIEQTDRNAPSRIRYPDGSQRDQSYDGLLRLTGLHVSTPGRITLLDYRYDYDAESNITQKTTEHGSYHYGYDSLYRLTRADNPAPLARESYTYDAVGNRLTDSRTNGLFSTNRWTYNADNQLLQHYSQQGNPVQNDYDANGSLIKKTSPTGATSDNQQFVYDAQNRLVEVRDGSGNRVASYRYDPFGRRIQKTVYRDGQNQPLALAVTTWFIYGEEGLLAEADESGRITRQYGWHPQGSWGTDPVFVQTTHRGGTQAELFFYQNDHLGTPQQLMDSAGAIVWQGRATAFGETQVLSGAQVENNLRFPGQYWDAETGLHQNYFREYWSSGGRYVEGDPIGLGGGVNRYGYVGGNPLSYTDPMGLASDGGPYHPPDGVKLKCVDSDACPQLEAKMQQLKRMIDSHQGWDWNNPPPPRWWQAFRGNCWIVEGLCEMPGNS